jgi:hypothetical protein
MTFRMIVNAGVGAGLTEKTDARNTEHVGGQVAMILLWVIPSGKRNYA